MSAPLNLSDFFNRSPAFLAFSQRRQRREDTQRARVLYAAPALAQCNFLSPLCQLAAEFAGRVCANARPFDGQPHAIPAEWATCSTCPAVLCHAQCGQTEGHTCRHAMCTACRAARTTFCNGCHRVFTGCTICRTPGICRKRMHRMYYCYDCRPSTRDFCLGCLRHWPKDPAIDAHKHKRKREPVYNRQ